jgi:hypothetical protein
MKKKGVEMSALTWLILALIIMVVVIVIIFVSKGRLNGFIDVIKSIIRFGGG